MNEANSFVKDFEVCMFLNFQLYLIIKNTLTTTNECQ